MELWRDVAAFILVFGLLALAVAAMRKRNGQTSGFFRPSGAKALTSLERIALTPQHALHLVRAAGRELVLVTHPQGCTIVSETRTGDVAGEVNLLRREEHA